MEVGETDGFVSAGNVIFRLKSNIYLSKEEISNFKEIYIAITGNWNWKFRIIAAYVSLLWLDRLRKYITALRKIEREPNWVFYYNINSVKYKLSITLPTTLSLVNYAQRISNIS